MNLVSVDDKFLVQEVTGMLKQFSYDGSDLTQKFTFDPSMSDHIFRSLNEERWGKLFYEEDSGLHIVGRCYPKQRMIVKNIVTINGYGDRKDSFFTNRLAERIVDKYDLMLYGSGRLGVPEDRLGSISVLENNITNLIEADKKMQRMLNAMVDEVMSKYD